MNINSGDVVALLVLAGLATGFSAAAQRRASSMGLPPLVVTAAGALAATAVTRAWRGR
jgi:hypothetical protein